MSGGRLIRISPDTTSGIPDGQQPPLRGCPSGVRRQKGGESFPQQLRAERDDLPLIQDRPHLAPVTIDTIGRSNGPIQVWRNWQSDTVGTVVWHGGMKTPLTADWPVSKDSAK